VSDYNIVIVEGRLTADPELARTNGGKSVVNFSIANNGRREDDVSFFDITAWEKTAENIANYKKKGHLVKVQGRLDQRRFERKDGSKGSKVEIIADQVQFMSSGAPQGEAGSNGGGERAKAGAAAGGADFDPTTIPF
jgi:single-strand DNA-binding protein